MHTCTVDNADLPIGEEARRGGTGRPPWGRGKGRGSVPAHVPCAAPKSALTPMQWGCGPVSTKPAMLTADGCKSSRDAEYPGVRPLYTVNALIQYCMY